MTWEIREGDCVEQMCELDEASIDAIVCDPPTGYWLAGLIDGEGCFRIQKNKSRKSRGPVTYATSFALKLRDDDEPILREIIAHTGVGRFSRDANRTGNSRPCAIWHVDAQRDCAALVELLDRYPLRTRKARDYAVWREAVVYWLSTPRGNRWHGPRDYSRMAELQVDLAEAREYRKGVMPSVVDR
jgi:hypothetical protein